LKNNNISNRVAPNIAFRVEDFLLEYKDKTILDDLSNLLTGKLYRAEKNKLVISTLYKILQHTDYTADLVMLKRNASDRVKERLDDLPFSNLILVEDVDEITLMLNTGRIKYYVDKKERLSRINNEYAISLERARNII
jgi:hypothetical protein